MDRLEREYWTLWEPHGQSWQKILGLVDPAVDLFVRRRAGARHKVEVLRYRWDAPDRTLIFPSTSGGGVWNNIHLLILGPPDPLKIRFSCAAWKDTELPGIRSPRSRIWCHSSADA